MGIRRGVLGCNYIAFRITADCEVGNDKNPHRILNYFDLRGN